MTARWRTLTLLVALVAISIATRWLSLVVDVVDLDETCHIVGAWQLLRGGLLYTDFVDNKPPLVYVYYAATQLLAGRGLFAVHLLTAVAVVPLTALAVSACYRHTRVGIVAAVIFLLYGAAFLAHDMLATNAEVLMVLPAAWAIVLVCEEQHAHRRWRVFAAGVLFGASVLFKPQVAIWIVAVGAVLAWSEAARGKRLEGVKVVALLGAGASVPVLLALAYFGARGGLGAFVYWVGVQSLWYAENPITPREAATRLGGNLVPFLVVTAPLWAAWWKGAGLLRPRSWRLLVSALVVGSVPAALLGFRFYPHYFVQFYVPLSLASAPWIERQLQRPLTRAGRTVVVWTAVAVAGFAIANASLYLTRSRVYRERDPIFRAVADRLRADPCARRGSLFVWGWAPIIYYLAEMPPASRFVVLPQARLTGYVFGNLASNRGELPESPAVPEHWDLLMRDLERHRATFIVDTAPANIYRWGKYPMERYPRLNGYVARGFTRVADVDGIRIYRRVGCETTPDAAAREEGEPVAP